MFNDKYGLTQAVLEGRKTMTRRLVPKSALWSYPTDTDLRVDMRKAPYKVGEVVAIAQSYKDVYNSGYPVDSRYDPFRTAYSVGVLENKKGWNNKMFVRADIMPRRIKITNIKVERLQDISDEDILREGVLQSADGYDFYTFDGWVKRAKGEELPTQIYTKNRREAFAALINKVSGKGTWDSNPWVFAYEFELIN